MALPSSPPLLPEQDLPSAPTLQSLASAPDANAGPSASTRKRPHELSDLACWSSDPLFSDASTDGDACQYEVDQPRRKRLVRGPWWNLRRASVHSLRRNLVKKERLRNGDSGVWMGSDESQESVDSIISGQQRLQQLAMDDIPEDERQYDDKKPESEVLAARIVDSCVEAGKERVDISDLALTCLSDETLRPLQHLIRQSFADFTHPPSEEEFSPLTPSIQLFLSRNRLSVLPPELFRLTNITVLSLRNNDLAHLPSAIGRLTKLTELNIAGNGLRHLPWELLNMLHCPGKQRQITIRPNPLREPCDFSGPSPFRTSNYTTAVKPESLGRWADTRDVVDGMRRRYEAEHGKLSMRGELELRLKLGRMLRIQYLQEASRAGRELRLGREELIHLASSAIRYFGPDGTILRHTGAPRTETVDYSAVLDPTATIPPIYGSAAAPSLFELTLRSLQTNYNLDDFLQHLPDSNISSSLAFAIRQAAANVAGNGNETCATCGKSSIIARAEWMEYWFHGFPSQQEVLAESVLPFLRKACSWGCARPSEVGEFRC